MPLFPTHPLLHNPDHLESIIGNLIDRTIGPSITNLGTHVKNIKTVQILFDCIKLCFLLGLK